MQLVRAIIALAGIVLAGPLAAQNSLEELRSDLAGDIRNSDIGAGYAQMLNFFVAPSISASRLEADDGTEYDVFKLPLQFKYPLGEGGWQLAVRGTVSHARAKNRFEVVEGEPIDLEWKADSGEVGVGLIYPAGESLSLFVSGGYGISRLKSDADYSGIVTEGLLAPIIDGILFNWETNARIASLTGGFDYQRRMAERFDLELTGRYTYSHIASYSESRGLPSFSEDTGTVSVNADLRHALGATLWERPLFGVVHLGGTAFTGASRDALGFTHFYELGYSLGLDVSEHNRYFSDFSLGYQWNTGSDVDGHSLVLAWRLK